MIKVLVVEDSPVVAELMTYLLNSDPDIQVVGVARDGVQAIEMVKAKKLDVITMDLHMPKMDGLEATRIIMETTPKPIVIVSGTTDVREVEIAFQIIEAGALAALPSPTGIGHPNHEQTARELVQTVKLMSEVKVVKRWARMRRRDTAKEREAKPSVKVTQASVNIKLVAIGASTGGPVIINNILAELPKPFPVPVLIVQHMASGFIQGFVEWLAKSSRCPVHIAIHNEYPLAGHVYIAPDEVHMGVGLNGRMVLSKDALENGLRPSVSHLFRSVADVFGPNAVGVLLTGMGRDGADELRLMREKGAITIAQDKESSVVHGMPGEAIKLDGATYVLPANAIVATLVSLLSGQQGQ